LIGIPNQFSRRCDAEGIILRVSASSREMIFLPHLNSTLAHLA